MFARSGTDYEIRNQLFFAILEALLLFNIKYYKPISLCTKNVFVLFFSGRCPCMAIDVSVQHNGGFLPGILYC